MARAGWAVVVPGVLLLPLVLSAARRAPGNDGDLVIELSLSAGLLASSLLAVTVVAASRLRSLTAAFGIERVLVSHRWFGLLALVLAVVHTGLVLIDDPGNVRLITFVHAPPRARAATGALIALGVLCGLAIVRKRLRNYEFWRWLHIGLAATALVLTGLHVYWLNHLIRDPVMRAWFVGCAAVVIAVAVRRWVLRPLLAPRLFVLRELRKETDDVTTIVLRPRHAWQGGLRFAPGQFAWIRIEGSGRPWEEHPFTIASNAHRPRQLEFTIRHVGDFTGRLGQLRRGQTVHVDGPHGSFTVDHRPARGVLLVAGGVGITPMISILRTLAHRRDRRPVRLVVGARHEGDLLFRAELAALTRKLILRVDEVLSDPPADWAGGRGRIDAARLGAALPGSRRERADVDAYICGPPALVTTALEALTDLGLPPGHIHTEQFDMV